MCPGRHTSRNENGTPEGAIPSRKVPCLPGSFRDEPCSAQGPFSEKCAGSGPSLLGPEPAHSIPPSCIPAVESVPSVQSVVDSAGAAVGAGGWGGYNRRTTPAHVTVLAPGDRMDLKARLQRADALRQTIVSGYVLASPGAREAIDAPQHDGFTLHARPRAATVQFEHTIVATPRGAMIVTL